MARLKLKDNSVINVIEASVSENSFQVETTPEGMVELFNSLNQKNLSKIELQNETGATMAVFVNKDKVSCEYEAGKATYILRNIDTIEVRLTELESAFEELSLIVLDLLGEEE